MSSDPSNPRLSKVAVFALIYGVLAFPVIGMFFAILAIIFGHVGLWKCKKSASNPSPLRGRRAAMIGLILGYLSLLSSPLIIIGLSSAGYLKKDDILRAYNDLYLEKRTQQSYDSAARLYLACETFASQHNELYPPSWNELVGRYLTKNDLRVLLKSSHPKGPAESFRLVPHVRPVPLSETPNTIVIKEIAPPNVAEVVIVYADGNTDLIPNPDADVIPESRSFFEAIP